MLCTPPLPALESAWEPFHSSCQCCEQSFQKGSLCHALLCLSPLFTLLQYQRKVATAMPALLYADCPDSTALRGMLCIHCCSLCPD